MNNRDDLSAQQVLAEHLRFGDAFPQLESAKQAVNARVGDHARIRVGFLSGDFNQHPVALFLRPVLIHRDRAHFEIFFVVENFLVGRLCSFELRSV